MLELTQRRDALQKEVNKYISRGYRVVSQTGTTAQLMKPKSFSFFWAVAWFLLFGVGILIYLFYYWSKKDETVYLQVDEQGRVKRS